jgi:IMP dehydrogenase
MNPSKYPEALSFDDVLLVPKMSTIEHRGDVDLSTSISNVPLRIPIVSANMSSISGPEMVLAIERMGGLGLLHRMYGNTKTLLDDLNYIADNRAYAGGAIGFSFGVGENWREWVDIGRNSYCNIGCLDVAHADHQRVMEIIPYLARLEFPFIIGNIATQAAAQRILNAWVSESGYYNVKYLTLKVGIGGGSLCTTRIMTGCGMPTFASIYDVFMASPDIDIIADGGIKSSGDIMKSLGIGASAVMLGNLLAGTSETPGDVIAYGQNKALYKVYRGSASFGDKKVRGEQTINIEGTETLVPYKGSVVGVVNGLLDGIRSGCSYIGSPNVGEIILRSDFVKVTQSGMRESHPHGL